jgi:hypothetical protein
MSDWYCYKHHRDVHKFEDCPLCWPYACPHEEATWIDDTWYCDGCNEAIVESDEGWVVAPA